MLSCTFLSLFYNGLLLPASGRTFRKCSKGVTDISEDASSMCATVPEDPSLTPDVQMEESDTGILNLVRHMLKCLCLNC